MKKLLFVLILILFVGIGISAGRNYTQDLIVKNQPSNSGLAQTIPDKAPTPTELPKVTFSPPQKLIIPKIGVESFAESVGLDNLGRMDVPKKAANVGWYNLGAKVGEKGSVVLAGHFDDINGAPAVFYNLNQLQIGDQFTVIDKANKTWNYKVTNKQIYDFDKVPLTEVFASNDKQRLNLITCDGIFSQSSNTYSKRLVVYSEAID